MINDDNDDGDDIVKDQIIDGTTLCVDDMVHTRQSDLVTPDNHHYESQILVYLLLEQIFIFL